MKIITENAVYVQRNDIGFLIEANLNLPISIFSVIFKDDILFSIDETNRYEFVTYTDQKDMDFFKSLDFIIDYADYQDMTEEEIKAILKHMTNELNKFATKWNRLSKDNAKESIKIIQDFEKMTYTYCSLIDFLHFKQGSIKYELPDGITPQQP